MSCEYVEALYRVSSNLVKELANVNVVISEPEELKSKLSSRHLSPTGKTKLTNSNVLQNLESKLSHLEESQCQDLKKLLQEYQDLFSDAFSKTDHIYYDVEVSDASPVKQYLYRLNPKPLMQLLSKKVKFFL